MKPKVIISTLVPPPVKKRMQARAKRAKQSLSEFIYLMINQYDDVLTHNEKELRKDERISKSTSRVSKESKACKEVS